MDIGKPKREYEVEPVTLPVPEVLPDPMPEPSPAVEPEPVHPAREAPATT
jgi:hypothetical protein